MKTSFIFTFVFIFVFDCTRGERLHNARWTAVRVYRDHAHRWIQTRYCSEVSQSLCSFHPSPNSSLLRHLSPPLFSIISIALHSSPPFSPLSSTPLHSPPYLHLISLSSTPLHSTYEGKRVQRAYVRTDGGLRGSISVYDLIDEMIDVDVVNLADYIQVRIPPYPLHSHPLSAPLFTPLSTPLFTPLSLPLPPLVHSFVPLSAQLFF